MTQWGRPELPARPKRNPDDLATHFGAFLGKGYIGVDRGGNLTVRFTVPAEDKWKALMLDAAEGFMVDVEVWRTRHTDADLAERLGRE